MHALAQIVGKAVVGVGDKKTYSDVLRHNINTTMSIPHIYTLTNAQHTTHMITNAAHATGAAGLGAPAQIQRRPAANEVPSSTASSIGSMGDRRSIEPYQRSMNKYIARDHDFLVVGKTRVVEGSDNEHVRSLGL